MPRLPYHLGCPVWACDGWIGDLYANRNRKNWLAAYSHVFNTVEGNSTFYGMPTESTVRRWATETGEGFRFALKFPRVITHEAQLQNVDDTTRKFLRRLEILADADRLGPAFLQLPPSFSAASLPRLAKYLKRLPRELPFAVEVRHFDFYDQGPVEEQLQALLTGLGMDWVLFDSRALFATPPADEYERESQRRKPRTPFRTTVTAGSPLLRFVGRNDVDAVGEWIDGWATVVAGWVRDGLEPYVFTHSPNDHFAPSFARQFHERLAEQLTELPALPSPTGQSARKPDSHQPLLF